jgi:egghead protein (zeste-white 4 protein)
MHRAPWETETRLDLKAIPTSDNTITEDQYYDKDLLSGPENWRRETYVHRLRVVVLIALSVTLLYVFQQVLWPHQHTPQSLGGWIWSWLGILWVIPVLPAMFELAGLLTWKAPRQHAQFIDNLVCFRIVSRGLNVDALRSTIEACQREMKRTPLFLAVIEVIMDSADARHLLPPEDGMIHYIIVPKGYQTPGLSRNKARALNYALWNSYLPKYSWILHCDEETHPTRSSIIGIAAAIREEEERAKLGYRPRIGQGTITYHRDWARHPIFTLSDCIRTGSDLGRLSLSMKIGVPLFGLHGSYILVRNDVEKELGFDVGPVGSLTEDAWWGTIAMDKGYRCRWIEGHMAEQCTFKVSDFLNQRRRWFNGMYRTARQAPVRYRWRGVLMTSMYAWSIAPIAWIYTIGHVVFGGYTSPDIRMAANLSLAIYVTTTLVGLRVNMREHGITHLAQKIRWALTWLVFLVPFSFMEATAVTYAIAKPAKTFHVVKK